MRLLHVIASVDPAHGGPIQNALRLSEIWHRQGHSVEFATLDAADAPYLDEVGSPVRALGSLGARDRNGGALSLWERFAYSSELAPWLRRHAGDYDAIIVHSLWNYSTLAARRALIGGTTPFFMFPHGCLDPWFKRAYPLKHLAKQLIWPVSEGVLMNRAAAVLFTTEEERDLAANAFWPYRIKADLVPYGSVDAPDRPAQQIAAFHAALPALRQRRYLLFLSRIHRKKGCDLLVKAFASLAFEHPTLDLVMAGPDQVGWKAELQEIAASLGVAERIHWPGMIDGDVKWGAYRACEAFVLPSHSENFGVVVAEAAACGRPLLITNKVNLWSAVAASRAGFVEEDTLDGTVRMLSRFVSLDPAEKDAMGRRARQCFEDNFRIDAAAARFIDVLRRNGANG
jgi:glycosyltransferase involved in cell wall biosynthesis